MKEKIENRLNLAIKNLDNDNFGELFPLILDDLNYILVDFKRDKEYLTPLEIYNHIGDLNRKIIVYFSKLSKIYFKLKHALDIEIVKSTDDFLVFAGGGYSEGDGKIYYSDFGVTLLKNSELSFLHTCLHEVRHKMQHQYYKTNKMLSFPPHMLKLLKENLLENSLHDNNGKFYQDNYDILFSENEAEFFARGEMYNFIKNLADLYFENVPDAANNYDKLLNKITKINIIFSKELSRELFNVSYDISLQLSNERPISGNYKFEGDLSDRLIMMDKYIKANPELQEKYPVLKLLFNGNVPKTYEEIIADRERYKKDKAPVEIKKIDELYKEIIASDPILVLTESLEDNDLEFFKDYINFHPTIISQYSNELRELNEKYNFMDTLKK